MPSLRVTVPGHAQTQHALWKTVTSLGRGPDNDIVVPDPSLEETHAHIHYDGRDFVLSCIGRSSEFKVDGKRRHKHRLTHQDIVSLGQVALEFSIFDAPPLESQGAQAMAELLEYRRLYDFSLELLADDDVPRLLEKLMDTVVSVTSADKAFLLLEEEGQLAVKVARNVHRENVADAIEQLSDTIVAKVVRGRRALLVSDALHDAEFANSMSVLHLRVSSVLCVPLLLGEQLLGLIYVGSGNVTRLFSQHHLEVLTVFAAQAALILRNALLVQSLRHDKQRLTERLEQSRFGEIVGSCAPMQEVFQRTERVAATDVTVLITGETGTGKELVAREIHARSARRKGPFVPINCGAIPDTLLESELFGHVRGAFTGAVSTRPGRFQAAHGGTLFLDEIGEMPLALQVKILRALQERSVMKVGDTRAEPVDIRIVAATNKRLEDEMKAGRFREDLYYRLNVVNLHLPPLRARGDDIVLLAKYLLQRFAPEYGGNATGFSQAALTAMRRHGWPGNIRELENRLKKAVVLSDRPLLEPDDLGLLPDEATPILPLTEARERWQREYINQVLEQNGGNRTKTARDLGVDPRTIFRHLEKEASDEPEGTPDGEGEVA